MTDIIVPVGWALAILVTCVIVETGAIASLVVLVFKDVRGFWENCPIKPVTIPALALLIPGVYVGTIIIAIEVFKTVTEG